MIGLARKAHCCNSGTNGMEVVNYCLIGFNTHSKRLNPFLVLLTRPKNPWLSRSYILGGEGSNILVSKLNVVLNCAISFNLYTHIEASLSCHFKVSFCSRWWLIQRTIPGQCITAFPPHLQGFSKNRGRTDCKSQKQWTCTVKLFIEHVGLLHTWTQKGHDCIRNLNKM